MAIILDGKATGNKIKDKLKELIWNSQLSPRLCIIQGGDRADSNQYVKNKIRACVEVGISVDLIKIPEGENYIDKLKEAVLEANKNTDGIIVQLPIPGILDTTQRSIIELIDKDKDVDCLRLDSEGAFYSTLNHQLAPCTPMGIVTLLKEYKIPLEGKKVCIVGRSKIVGRPLVELMLRENASVCICHSKTPKEKLYNDIISSDVVICAAGVPNLINYADIVMHCGDTSQWTLSQTTFIDVGTNHINGEWHGDVSQCVKDISYAYSPVPGGVGPMTIASLLQKVVSRCLINNYS